MLAVGGIIKGKHPANHAPPRLGHGTGCDASVDAMVSEICSLARTSRARLSFSASSTKKPAGISHRASDRVSWLRSCDRSVATTSLPPFSPGSKIGAPGMCSTWRPSRASACLLFRPCRNLRAKSADLKSTLFQ